MFSKIVPRFDNLVGIIINEFVPRFDNSVVIIINEFVPNLIIC